MKVALLYGNMPHYDYGLGKVVKIIKDTLSELGIDMEEINLGFSQLPMYDGIKAQATDDIVRQLREASGIVIACTAQLFAPTAILQTFLEYLELDEYNDVLHEKLCLLTVVSRAGGERSALTYLGQVVQHLGGYDCSHIGLQETHTRALETDESLREIIEKEVEDFYRAVRQNRKYIIPRDCTGRQRLSTLTGTDVGSLSLTAEKEKKEKLPVSEVYKRLNLDSFTEQQETEIQELTRLFSAKHASSDLADEYIKASLPDVRQPRAKTPVKPRTKTVKQITQSLPHYFQPQLSNGLTAVFQLTITGAENFEGYLSIVDTECEYADGVAPSPDITVIADTSVWRDVLFNKYTAQKAFMIGGLKVRGNFVLLTRFDTLFKLREG